MVRSPFRVAMWGGRAVCLVVVLLLVTAIVSVSSDGGEAVDGQTAAATPVPDTNVLCVSKCGTCPAVCSSPPPPPPPASSAAGDTTTPPTPKSGGGGSSSPPSTPGQGKGGRPSNYYYFFTAAGSRRSSSAGVSVYALVLLALVSVVANFQ